MAIDYSGLLTGISQDPKAHAAEMLAQSAIAQDPNIMAGAKYALGQAPRREAAMRQAAGGLLGRDLRSPVEKATQELQKLTTSPNFDISNPEQQNRLLELARVVNPAEAVKIAKGIKDRKISADRRQSLITQAMRLNLDTTVELLKKGGDLKTAEEQVLEAEERNIVSKQGRRGRARVAEAKGAAKPMVDAILRGDYDNVSDSLFLEELSGEKASIKFFQQTDAEGNTASVAFPVNEAGQVRNPQTEKWVYPDELGLTQAPVTTQQLSAGNEVTQQLTQGFVDTFVELNSLGRQAEKMLEINRASALDLDKIYTGKLAPVQLAIMDVGKSLGIISPEQEDAVVATQTFMINRAKQVLPLIKALGSGTAISDKDREFIEKIVAGDISLSLDTIKRVIEIENEYAVKAVTKSNAALERLTTIKGADIDPSVVAGLYITVPSFSPRVGGEISPDAQSVIERAKQRALRNTGIR